MQILQCGSSINVFFHICFTTYVVVEPTIIADSASDISETSAVLNGSITSKGVHTTYYFEYGPTAEFGFSTSVDTLKQDTAIVKVHSSINNLSPGTLYYWRITAKYNEGTYYSSHSTFTTYVDYYPLAVGKIWKYDYTGFYYHPGDTNSYDDKGTMIWEIKSSTINNDTTEYVFSEISDLIRIYWQREDTINLAEEKFFSIKEIHNQLIMPSAYSGIRKIARYYPTETPEQIDVGINYYTDRFILQRERGLLEYYYKYGAHHRWSSTYRLIDD